MQTNPLATHRSLLQTANPALAAKRQAAAAKPEFTGPKARTGDFVVLSRAALAQSRAPAAQNAPNLQATEPTGKDAKPTAPLTPAAAPRGLPAAYGQLDLDAIRQHFGTKTGDENFYSGADSDGNGVVDFRDMTHVLANWGQTRS